MAQQASFKGQLQERKRLSTSNSCKNKDLLGMCRQSSGKITGKEQVKTRTQTVVK